MGAVDRRHAGVASGVNNAVARVAGLVAIAVFGVVLARTFEARTGRALDNLQLPAAARTAIERELSKMAGADLEKVPALDSSQRAAVRAAVIEAFVPAYRLVFAGAAALMFIAAIAGALLHVSPRPTTESKSPDRFALRE
jgi:hypothetical protein